MSNGNHFIPGVPLAGSSSLTPSDIDTSQSGIRLGNGRGLIYFSATPPTSVTSPDWENLIWAYPVPDTNAVYLKAYSTNTESWVPVWANFPDANNITPNSIPVDALQSTDLNVGMVPVVTGTGISRHVRWQTFVATDIPAASITQGSANNILATNNVGTGSIWTSLSSLLSALGKVVALGNLTQSGATTGQVPTWNGTAWLPATPYTPITPDISTSPWSIDSNWVNVYSSIIGKTVRMPRASALSTLASDYLPGTLSLNTKILGYEPSASTFTMQNVYDLVKPGIVAAANENAIKHFYSSLVVMDSVGANLSTLVAGVAHNLGGAPSKIGFKVIRTSTNGLSTSNGGLAGAITIPLGMEFDGRDIGFITNALHDDRIRVYVKADSTNIYVGFFSIAYSSSVNHDNVEVEVLTQDYSIQLYAYR